MHAHCAEKLFIGFFGQKINIFAAKPSVNQVVTWCKVCLNQNAQSESIFGYFELCILVNRNKRKN